MSKPFDDLERLSELDAEILRLTRSRGQLPSRRAIEEFDVTASGILAERSVLAAERSPLDVSLRSLEQESETLRGRASVIEARLAAATGGGRDLAAMDAERAQLSAHARELEDRELELMEQIEPYEQRLIELDELLAPLQDVRAELAKSLANEEAELDRTLEDRKALRVAVSEAVGSELLERYERIASTMGGTGAARLIGGRCDGCHLQLPAVELDHLRKMPVDVVSTCEQCGRLLLRPDQLAS